MKLIKLFSVITLFILLATTQFANAQLSGKEILIDPGHGGTDPGALGVNGSALPNEADNVLNCGLELRNRFQSAGATVYMTRSSNVTVGLYTRRDLANSYNPDAYFSIHNNSADATSANGVETWYYHNSSLASNIQTKMIEQMALTDRGIKQNGWAVLTCNSSIPACLTEGGFISNSGDWDFITSTQGFEKWVTGQEHGVYSFFGINPPNGKPATPELISIISNNNIGVTASWTANSESDIAGYRLYYSTDDALGVWALAANESTLTASSLSVSFNSPSEFLVPTTEQVYFFRVTAVNAEGIESEPSDIYSKSSLADGSGANKVLIVDGFDRLASYNLPTHLFGTDYFKAIRDNGNYVVSSTANEPVAEGIINLNDYDIVIWFVGDESTVKETFSVNEQGRIKSYLESGGNLFVSGSEIGWDLSEKGSTDDKAFYSNYFKANYLSDGGSGRSPATGIGSFSGTSLNFGQTYVEDYPDEISPITGGEAILTYANGATGGIVYKGIIGNGTSDATIAYIAFPFESTSDDNEKLLFMGKLLDYFNDGSPIADFTISGMPAVTGVDISFDASTSSDPNGTIVSYNWNFGDGTTASGAIVNHAYLTEDTYTVTLIVTDNDGKDNQTSQVIEIANCPNPTETNIYIDNSSTQCTIIGEWSESTSNPNFYGTNYIHDQNLLKGEKSVIFTPSIVFSGFYNIYERHTAGTNRATNVPVEISSVGSTYVNFINQQENDGTWILLGRYYFEAGNTGKVTIKNEGTTEVVIADAIQFEWDGCDGNIPPSASFSTPVTNIPSGTSIIFKNQSTDASSYSWAFSGGNPATSSDENPIVGYSMPGIYSATLTAINGTETSTHEMTITVYDGAVQAFNAKYENRGVWLTTNYNLDWPSTKGLSVVAQQNELNALLDAIADANFNTVYLQVRSRGDLLYPSSIEPWADALSGLGVDPGYDPLEYAIEQAHNRGIEIHAWMVTYRVYSSATPVSTSPEHVVLAHPEWIKNYDDGGIITKWLDPGIPEVNQYLLSIIDELATNYPTLDGVQFDYVRYPNQDFDDNETYVSYGTGWTNKDDWRRNNVNQFVYAAYDLINAINPNIKVGSAPIGIYQSTSEFTGWNGFSDIMQDSRDWMSKNKHDYACPQIYWDLESNPKFNLVAADWVNNSYGKQINTGIHVSSLNSSKAKGSDIVEEHNWINLDRNNLKQVTLWTSDEVRNQILASRSVNSNGQSFYRTEDIFNNVQNIKTLLKENEFKYPAINPAMPWKDNVVPNIPQNLLVIAISDTEYTLSWDAPTNASDGDTAKYYIVYQSNTANVDISSPANIKGFKITDTSLSITLEEAPSNDLYFVITTLDDANNESAASNEVIIEAVLSKVITVIDDFEIDMGHFAVDVDYSGTTVGVNGTTSSKNRVTTFPKNGNGSLEIILNDDNSVSTGWKVRVLSGIGNPSNNTSIPTDATIQLWMATSTANSLANIYLWIDDSDGIEQSTKAVVVNTGQYVLYTWDLTDNTVWSGITGNGLIDGSTVTIDAIMIEAPNASSTWTLNIDDVAYSIGEDPCIAPSITEIIIDNSNAILVGSWASSTSNPNYYGTDYLHDSGVLKGEKSVTYSANIEFDGYYEVFQWHTSGTNRSFDTPVEINIISTVCVNQQINEGIWLSLGTHFFSAGNGNVIIKNANTENVVIADGIKLVYAGCDANYVTLNLPATISIDIADSYNGLASANINNVIIKADGIEIANELVVGGVYNFNYTFSVTGTPIEFVTYAYDASNNLVTSLTQHKTVYVDAKAGALDNTQNQVVDKVSIFPNPTSGLLNITFSQGMKGNAQLTVFDIDGKLVYSKQISVLENGQAQVNLQHLNQGMYFVKFIGDNINKTLRLIKE